MTGLGYIGKYLDVDKSFGGVISANPLADQSKKLTLNAYALALIPLFLQKV